MLYLVPLQSKYNEKYKSKGKYTTTKRLFSFALGHHHPSNRTIFIGQFFLYNVDYRVGSNPDCGFEVHNF